MLYIYRNETQQKEHDIHQIIKKTQRETADEVKRGAVPGEVSPPQVYLSWESELWVIKIHWNSTSEHQCSSSAKPVNSGMSDSFYTASTGHSVCQTDLSLHLQWSWSPAPRPSLASNLSQRHPSRLLSKWREQNLLKCFRGDKGTVSESQTLLVDEYVDHGFLIVLSAFHLSKFKHGFLVVTNTRASFILV